MNSEEFNNKAGTVSISSNRAYFTFTPKIFPLEIRFDNNLICLLAKANLKIGQLSGLGFNLPNPHLIIKPYLKKEAVLSSKIEGTRSSLSDVFLQEVQKKNLEKKQADSDLKEVINYIEALEYGLNKIQNQELNIQLILDMHNILLTGVRGKNTEPGKIRKIQNWIGVPYSLISDASYVPPEPEKIKPLLINLFNYLNTDKTTPDLIKIGLVHYQFEAIHPFIDGNGRIGRLLILIYLIKNGLLSMPLLYLSGYFNKHRGKYYDLLLNISKKGEYIEWLTFFLNGVITQSDDISQRTKKLVDYWSETREELKQKSTSINSLMIFDSLLKNPYVSIPAASKIINKQYPSAKQAVEVLIKHGILTESTTGKRNKIYVAKKIINILE